MILETTIFCNGKRMKCRGQYVNLPKIGTNLKLNATENIYVTVLLFSERMNTEDFPIANIVTKLRKKCFNFKK